MEDDTPLKKEPDGVPASENIEAEMSTDEPVPTQDNSVIKMEEDPVDQMLDEPATTTQLENITEPENPPADVTPATVAPVKDTPMDDTPVTLPSTSAESTDIPAGLPELAPKPVETSVPSDVAAVPTSVEDTAEPMLSEPTPTMCLQMPSLDAPAPPPVVPVVSEPELIPTASIKTEMSLSGETSDEAILSECEKLLEENQEFEKSQSNQEGPSDHNDEEQDSSDTVSVDSDTAKAHENDFNNDSMDIDPPGPSQPLAPLKPSSPQKAEDPLSTLASAALGIKPSAVIKADVKKKSPVWCDVGVFTTPSCLVSGFYATSESNEYTTVTSNSLPNFDHLEKMNLEPGTAYKFRVCAVNSCGRGPWSDVSAFRTCLPGFPGAPSSIKISKATDGANISWQPPSSSSGNIIEYSVCLAVKKFNYRNEEIKPNPASLTFEKVYEGEFNHAVISSSALEKAYVDMTSKPAIIFRIAAKNDKGYGPATQVRWLQDIYAKK